MSELTASFPLPIVQAPMAGGASRPPLAAEVSEAGGLGFLAAGYKTPEAMRQEIAEMRALTSRPFGVNLFMPQPLPFNLLLNAVGIFLLSLHCLEVLFFNASLRGRSHRWFDRLQILLTGIFHVMSIPKPLETPRHA